jgi:anti-sigma regulatory factor (Ser/Thr protein kinase)
MVSFRIDAPSVPEPRMSKTGTRHTTGVEPFDLRVPAEPPALVQLRSELEAWLERAGVAEQAAFDAVAAASEAASNAIEHAQEPSQPYVDVHADRVGRMLSVTVRDYGQWRQPRFNTDRNHGLLLIDSLMTRVTIDRADAGTTIEMELDLGRGDGERG